MNNTVARSSIALLAFLMWSTAFAQTTFVTQKKSTSRIEVEVSGQAAEDALRDLHTLAEMRAHPQKLLDGKSFEFEIGSFTKMGEGLRVKLSSERWGELQLKRKG